MHQKIRFRSRIRVYWTSGRHHSALQTSQLD